LGAGVRRDLGGQTPKQISQRLGPMALQREEVLELADNPFYDLALAGGPAAVGLRPSPAGMVLRGGRHQRPVLLHPAPLPLDAREALVCQVGLVAILRYEGFAYGALVGGRRGQPEGPHHPVGVYHQGRLEGVEIHYMAPPFGDGLVPVA
jgi:hypothetical protein